MQNVIFDTDASREEYLTLSAYLAKVQGLIEEEEGLPGWIVCELAKVSWSRGHCYLELVESGQGGNTLAKARGTIWSYKASVLNNIFRLGTGDDLREGIKVMLYVQVQFSPVYGLSLNVLDLNPSYTLGDMEAQRRAAWQRLQKEGLTERNKELEVPALPYRIAVVSASGAAGYGDFMKHLSDSGIRFEVKLFEAAMQGAEAPASIESAFARINEWPFDFDVAVLIRGGGSNLDLACFDDYLVARAVALCDLPVISGVGHERDNHLCDDVASVRVKTPTGAADYLIQKFADAFETIESLEQRTMDAYSEILEESSAVLERFSMRISNALGRFAEYRAEALKDLSHRIDSAVNVRVIGEEHALAILQRRVGEAVTLKTLQQENHLDALAIKMENKVSKRVVQEENRLVWFKVLIEGADPTRILDKGYGIILKDGKKVTDILQIEEGNRITIMMKDGKVTFTAGDVLCEKKEEDNNR